jgi:hypothetical protein
MVRAQYRWCPTVAIGAALANTWLGIVLAIVFFLATGVVEKTSAGEAILIGMDRLADPMAGLCRVYQGFGFLWTPLVRRLSAISLFVMFNAAVYPFGRVGHAQITAVIVAIAADRTREVFFTPRLKKGPNSVLPSAAPSRLRSSRSVTRDYMSASTVRKVPWPQASSG